MNFLKALFGISQPTPDAGPEPYHDNNIGSVDFLGMSPLLDQSISVRQFSNRVNLFLKTGFGQNSTNTMSTKATIGELRIRTSFDPSNVTPEHHIKELAAKFINYIDAIPVKEGTDAGRLKSLAMTSIEEASMWAVKAATS